MAASLSPGLYTQNMTRKIDAARKKRQKKQKSVDFKRKRNQLKKQRKEKDRKSFIHESVSYSSNLETSSNVGPDEYICIPSPAQINGTESFVTFDLESTGLGRSSDITEIAAICGNEEYHSYVMPRCAVSTEASKVTGITCSLAKNKLYVHGKEVSCVTQQSALLGLIDFLRSVSNPVLVGHNACSFDINILSEKLSEFQLLSTFHSLVPFFIDSLKVARRLFSKGDIGNYKQQTLVEKLLHRQYIAHSAIEDVRSLQELFDKTMKASICDQDLYSCKYSACKRSYQTLVRAKLINGEVVQKLSRNGISLNLLRVANLRDPKGARVILRENKIPTRWVDAITSSFQHEQ